MDPSRISLEDDRRGLTGLAFRFGNRVTYLGVEGVRHLWRVEIFVGPTDEIQIVETDDRGSKNPRQLPPGELFDALEILSALGSETFAVLSAFALTGVELRAANSADTEKLAVLLRTAADDLSYAIPLRLHGEDRPLNLSDQGRRVLHHLSAQLENDGHAMATLPAVKRLEPTASFLDGLSKRVHRERLQAYRVGDRWFVVVSNLAQEAEPAAPLSPEPVSDTPHAATAEPAAAVEQPVPENEADQTTAEFPTSSSEDIPSDAVTAPAAFAAPSPPSVEPVTVLPEEEPAAEDELDQEAADEQSDAAEPETPEPAPAGNGRRLYTALTAGPIVGDHATDLLIEHLRAEVAFLHEQMREKDLQIAAWIAEARQKDSVLNRLATRKRTVADSGDEPGSGDRVIRTAPAQPIDLATIRLEVLQPLAEQLQRVEARLSHLEATRGAQAATANREPAADDSERPPARQGRQPWYRRLTSAAGI